MTELRIILISRMASGEVNAPRTKKNHGRIVTVKGRAMMMPSPEYTRWETGCKRASIYDRTMPPITWRVNCAAKIYRHADVGDASGFYNAIGDCLEVMGVVKNDVLIRSWDGSELLKDTDNPRVEITLTPVTGAQFDLGLGEPGEKKRQKKEDLDVAHL